MIEPRLLSMWERGEGQRPSRRALALLADPSRAGLPVGQRDAALLALRVELFGRAFTGVTACPACAEELETTFDADEVRREPLTNDATLRVDDYELTLRVPRTDDLAAIEELDDLDDARAMLLQRCIDVPVETLPAHVIEAVVARLEALDPQADVSIEVTCPACGHTWREPFDIASFLWTEVAATARRLLGEVHELASAYGWSEEEILRLSPPRRAAYLEMVR